MQKLAIFLIVIWLALTGYTIYQHVELVQVIDKKENKIEALEDSNATLQQERDEVHEINEQLNVELWDLKNGLTNDVE